MTRHLHRLLLLIFFLTSIGQFAYACVDMEEPTSPSVVCCCDVDSVANDNACPMEASALSVQSDSASCCEVHYQVTASDGSPVDSPPPQLFKKLDLDFGSIPVAAITSYPEVLFGAFAPGAFSYATITSAFSPRQPVYLLTQRLRI